MQRVNVNAFRRLFDGMSEEELQAQNEADIARTEAEHAEFVAHYDSGTCYLCGKPFRTLSKSTPCVHWLLRRCKFKKKDFPLVYERFGYVQIAAFVLNRPGYRGGSKP